MSQDDPVTIASFEGPDAYYELEIQGGTLYKVIPNDPDASREVVHEGVGRWHSKDHSWDDMNDRGSDRG